MDISTITTIVLYVLAIAAAIWIFKALARVLFAVLLITLLFLGALGFLAYKDIVDLRTNLKDGVMVVMVEDGSVLSGFEVKEGEPSFFSENRRMNLAPLYSKKDYQAMLEGNNRLFIMHSESLAPLEELEAELGNFTLTKEDIFAVLHSKDVKKDILLRHPAVNLESMSGDEIKGMLTGSIFTRYIIQRPAFAIAQLKEGTLEVYPSTITFRILKMAPSSALNSLGSKALEGGKEAKDALLDKVNKTA